LALKRALEQSKSDSHFAAAIDAVVHGESTSEQYAVFRKFMKKVKREEKDRHESAVNHRTSHIGQQPSPRASSELVPDDSVSAVHDIQDQQLTRPADSTTNNSHMALQSALDQDPTQAPPHPFSSAPALPAGDNSAESTPSLPSKSPRKRLSGNGNPAPDSAMDVDGGLSTTAPTPAARTPDTGGSDSELSDVNEEIVQKGPPEPVQVNGKSAATIVTVAQKKGKNAAHARAAKKAKANVGKLFGKHAYKQQPLTAEQQAEDDRLYEMRRTMVDEQPLRQFDNVTTPISDVRFDDEILDTESLTESQIAVGPPVGFDQPRRAGRIPHGTKRLREDPSRFSSPQFESGTTTRPTTPAQPIGPVTKRLKLTNGQGARTKRS
jgi:hypothetical protein